MASIISGYEYDIFISYRQKDNKYDGWVTEFVDHLKREIEATFKEEISIYFDENPHDGLLEIHNVDKSLENKLSSVVFIPVISQTYCDPGSFAWQNEFVAFNRMAGEDRFGRDVKLASGNVCSRIIPVRIHDLEAADMDLLEREMHCRPRSIDFIFSGSGVNRPLKPNDNPDKNLYKTFYRDQINKVANAVKQIIYGLHPDERKRVAKTYQTRSQAGYYSEQPPMEIARPPASRRISAGSAALIALGLLLVVAMIFFAPKLMQKDQQKFSDDSVRKAIAVMPVDNFTGNPDLEWIAEMIQSDLTGQLQGISDIIVRPKQTTLQFRKSEESVQQIAAKLTVNNLIESSIKGTEDNLQVEIKIVEAFPQEQYIYSASFSPDFSELEAVYSEVINRLLKAIKVKQTDQEEKALSAKRKVNPEVRKACARGQYHMNLLTSEGFEKGIKYYKEAINIDPADPEPYIGLSLGYSNAGHVSGSSEDAAALTTAYALKAIELDPEELHPSLADAHVVLATKYLYTDWDFAKAEHHLMRAIDLNPNSSAAQYTYGWYLALSGNADEAADEMKKAIVIDPLDPICSGYLAWLYLWFGSFDDAIKEARNTLLVNPEYHMASYVMGLSFANKGRYDEAIDILKKIYTPQSGFASGLGVAYAKAGMQDKALETAAEMEKQNMIWHTWGLATIYAALGDNEKALYWIEEAYKQRHDFVPWFRNDASFKSLADEPKFKEIVARLNLPDL